MKRFTTLLIALVCCSFATAQEQQLFNGRDLTGWDGKPGWWYVEDGALTSESTQEKPCRRANYLVWTGGEPSDFELNLDFKLSPQIPKSNSGVQIRSERRPDWDTFGYQADMTATGHLVGYVYHHARGLIAARGETVKIASDGKRQAEKLAHADAINAAFKPGEWNHYRIICNGPAITLYVNGVLMCEFTDHDAKQARSDGIIALQMHPGPPMKVQFKNIVLKPLNNAASVDPEMALVNVLRSDAGVKEKSDACRRLLQVGTAASVPALAALLDDPALSHMARYALLGIPAEAAGEALRAALDSVQEGERLAGVALTVGERGDTEAVDVLAGLLAHRDPKVAQAAAGALASIATQEAINHLRAASGDAPETLQATLNGALLDAAGKAEDAGRKQDALGVYDELRVRNSASGAIRGAALRGAILLRGADGLPLLVESLRGKDTAASAAALMVVEELREHGAALFLANALNSLPAERQVLVAGALGELKDESAVPSLLALAKAGEQDARVAAIRSLAELGAGSLVASLADLMQDSDAAVATEAQSALSALRGQDADTGIVERLKSAEGAARMQLIEVVAHRRIDAAKPVLAGLMAGPDAGLRQAAIRGYGRFASADDLGVLLDVSTKSKDAADITALGKALVAAYRNGGKTAVCAPQVAAALGQASAEAKPMLEKVLQRIEKAGTK